MATMGQPVPTDWTNGTGVFPGGGSIAVPANPRRQWLFVQNQDVGTVQMQVAAVKGSDGSATSATILLGPGAASGAQGASDELAATQYVLAGAVTINGTGGQKVAVLEA